MGYVHDCASASVNLIQAQARLLGNLPPSLPLSPPPFCTRSFPFFLPLCLPLSPNEGTLWVIGTCGEPPAEWSPVLGEPGARLAPRDDHALRIWRSLVPALITLEAFMNLSPPTWNNKKESCLCVLGAVAHVPCLGKRHRIHVLCRKSDTGSLGKVC